MMHFLQITTLVALLSNCYADVYMHNPRGSNDRNCERNVNRNNGNRLFDSQNNAKGGYACDRPVAGPEYEAQGGDKKVMTYYSGSVLPIEWTAQHGCGENPDVHCEIVIQYACEDTLDPAGKYAHQQGTIRYTGSPRDGTPRDPQDAATNTIPDNEESAKATTVETRRFGMHETHEYYADCQTRQRNKGLFAADQKLKRRDARATRQNPNGNRNGFECPEERDYYPYWHPTPWVDIAVVVSNYQSDKIAYYTANSQNNVAKGYCKPGTSQAAQQNYQQKKNRREWHNNKAACEAENLHTWTSAPAYNRSFEVVRGQFSRTNHLGNVGAGNDQTGISKHPAFPAGNNFNRYYWTIPELEKDQQDCTLRIRYNISTSDYDSWALGDYSSVAWSGGPGANASFNGKENSPIYQDPKTYFSTTGAVSEEQKTTSTDFLTLALNTNQYGRTFQDRSYTFAIKKRPADIPANANIYNLNVEGKRGNIVQTFPAVEYHFVPDDIVTKEGDYLHIQWTGSDYNPRRGCNNGEGGPPDPPNSVEAAKKNSRADRSNFVITKMGADNTPEYYEHGKSVAKAFDTFFESQEQGKRFAMLDQVQDLQKKGLVCLTAEQLKQFKNKNQRENHPANCGKLNGQESPYFDGGLVKMTKSGKYSYFSSRNNNFSNRDQTGHICVDKQNENKCTLNADDYSTVAQVTHAKINLTALQIAEAATLNRAADNDVLSKETKTFIERDNDSEGDGNEQSCVGPLYENMYSLSLPGALAVGSAGFLLGSFIIASVFIVRARIRKGPKYSKLDAAAYKA